MKPLFSLHFVNFLIILFFTTHAIAQEKPLFAIDLIRHGDRTPINEIPNSPYQWPEGLGELTAEGMQQEFQLGSQLRKRYIEQYHLLPERYSAKTMYVRSSDLNRTLMSAQSFLMGLYPLGTGSSLPAKFQPIPIHTISQHVDNLLLAKPPRNLSFFINYYLPRSKEWNRKKISLQSKLNAWSKITGFDLNNPEMLGTFGNNLYIRRLHNVPLPTGISSQDADEIIQLHVWLFTNAYRYKVRSYPTGHAFLSEVKKYLEQAKTNPSDLKYVLFSGHDSTIASVMNTLGLTLNEIPPYASDLNFTLIKDNTNYLVKITYNNKPVIVPACGATTCSFDQFSKLVEI